MVHQLPLLDLNRGAFGENEKVVDFPDDSATHRAGIASDSAKSIFLFKNLP